MVQEEVKLKTELSKRDQNLFFSEIFCINCFEIQSVREIQLSREVTQAALFKQANNIESAAFVHHNFKGIVFYWHTTYGT